MENTRQNKLIADIEEKNKAAEARIKPYFNKIVVTDPLKADIGIDHRRAVGQQIGRAAQRRIRSKRDDKRWQSGKSNQRAVKQPQHQTEHQRRRNRQHGKLRDQRNDHSRDGGGAENRANREVDPAGQNNEGHASRQHDVDRRLAGYIQQVAFGKKVWRDKAKHRHYQDENRQDADRLHQIAHQQFFRGGGFRHLLGSGWIIHGTPPDDGSRSRRLPAS